jgi:hypothetical protein
MLLVLLKASSNVNHNPKSVHHASLRTVLGAIAPSSVGCRASSVGFSAATRLFRCTHPLF